MPRGGKTVTDAEIISRLKQLDGPAFVVSELADEFDMTEEGLRNRLEQLHEQGEIRRKKPSSRVVLWWAEEDHDDAPYPSLE